MKMQPSLISKNSPLDRLRQRQGTLVRGLSTSDREGVGLSDK